jgi:hypothetical protein
MSSVWYRDPITKEWKPVSLVGSQGAKGATGVKGGVGLKGDTGEKGPTGAVGDTGPKGDTGPGGAAGDKGPVGPKGLTGATGDPGPKGTTGGPGGPGGTGATGATGADHPNQIRIGMAAVNPAANANTNGGRVYFSAAFRVNCNVVTSMRSSVPGNVYYNCAANNIGLDGFDVWVYRTNTTQCLVDWIAVGTR